MKEPDMGAQIMEERLTWAKLMCERLIGLNFKDMPIELKVKTLEVGISLYIQKERGHSKA